MKRQGGLDIMIQKSVMEKEGSFEETTFKLRHEGKREQWEVAWSREICCRWKAEIWEGINE